MDNSPINYQTTYQGTHLLGIALAGNSNDGDADGNSSCDSDEHAIHAPNTSRKYMRAYTKPLHFGIATAAQRHLELQTTCKAG